MDAYSRVCFLRIFIYILLLDTTQSTVRRDSFSLGGFVAINFLSSPLIHYAHVISKPLTGHSLVRTGDDLMAINSAFVSTQTAWAWLARAPSTACASASAPPLAAQPHLAPPPQASQPREPSLPCRGERRYTEQTAGVRLKKTKRGHFASSEG